MLTLKSVLGGSDDRPEEKMTSIETAKIIVGERFRKDLGDVEGLARSTPLRESTRSGFVCAPAGVS